MVTEAELLFRLKSLDLVGIYESFNTLIGSVNLDLPRFGCFLVECFPIIQNLIFGDKIKSENNTSFQELLKVYQLCLSTLDTIPDFNKLDESWLSNNIQFLKGLEAYGFVDDFENHLNTLLEKVESSHAISKELHCNVLELYLYVFKISMKRNITEDQHCEELLHLMEKAKTWQRLNSNCRQCTKFHLQLIKILFEYVFIILKKSTFFDTNSGIKLCHSTLVEVMHSTTKQEKFYEVAYLMCRDLFELSKNNCTYVMDKLNHMPPDVEEKIQSILLIIVKGFHLHNCKSKEFEYLLEALCENKNTLQSSVQSIIECDDSMTYLSPSIKALHFLCGILTESFNDLPGWKQQLSTIEKDKVSRLKKIPIVVNVFLVHCELILASLSVTSEKKSNEKSWLVKVAGVAFYLSIRTNLEVQRSTKIIEDIFVSKWVDTTTAHGIVNWLNKGVITLQENNKADQAALQVLNLYCKVVWIFLKSHPRKFFQGDLEKFASKTYANIDSLLNLLGGADNSNVKEKIIGFLEDWSIVREQRFKNFPIPLCVVKTWVKCQCKDSSVNDENSRYHTLSDLLSPSKKVSMKNIGLLLEQEYNIYNEVSDKKYTSFCYKMKQKIISTFMLYKTPQSVSQTHSAKRKRFDIVLHCLEEAVKIMEEIAKNESASSETNIINPHLYVAKYLHDLCKPGANTFLEITLEDHNALSQSTMVLLYNIFDLLQLKALLFSKEAHRLHSQLFKSTFKGESEVIEFSTNIWEIFISIAEEVKPLNSSSSDIDKTYISPWKILQGYLETTLQVGMIYEMIGDGVEAVAYLQLGKNISCAFKLPLFIVAFSSLLGKLYTHQQKLDLAANEVELAGDLLNGKKKICCKKCEYLMLANLAVHFGDSCLIKSKQELARDTYENALESLTVNEWRNSISSDRDTRLKSVECSCSWLEKGSMPNNSQVNERVEKNKVLGQIVCTTYSTCSTKCTFRTIGCWHCLPLKVMKSGLLSDLINLKWEFVRRKFSMKLLSRLGRCFANSNQADEARKNLLKRISILVAKNALSYTLSSIPQYHFCNLVAKGVPNDLFAVERAEIVYDTCFYLMKNYHSSFASEIFSNQSSIMLKEISSWLIKAFVLSQDVPIIFQEVSKLLAVIYQISSTSEQSPLFISKDLNKDLWTFYFHQFSIGSHLSYQILINKLKGSNCSESSYIKESTSSILRLPESTEALEEHMNTFLSGLPSTTIVCLNFLGHEYNNLLEKFLHHPTGFKTYMLVSTRDVKAKPLAQLLPLNSILEGISYNYKRIKKEWRCPWGETKTIVDDVVPEFKRILEQFYYMVKEYHLSSDEEKRLLLKSQSAIFDKHLESLLSKIEESWFGSKKFLLLGDASYQPKVDGYPIILVLGYEVQMLPWESLSLLKDQEVYRMPSISSIHVVVDKCNIQKEQAERSLKSFQLIDPLHGFYILNPDGTLNIFQKVFEKYFIKKELKGKVNYEPTLKELTSVLENHNIFLYFGHGSGKQYIPDRVIKKLKECSAAILMGCRSGSLTLQGIYAPLGTPLSYLMAGSPFIVANLWDLLESEACLLGKTLFEESDSSNSYGHIRRIGDFVAKARNGCNRPFLTGAALVCYGVPVGIHRHEDILDKKDN